MHPVVAGDRSGLAAAWLDGEVTPEQASAAPPTHKEQIAGTSPIPSPGSPRRRAPEGSHAHDEWTIPGVCVAPSQGHIVLGRQRSDARLDAAAEFQPMLPRKGNGHKRGLGATPHGSQVAETHSQGLVPHGLRRALVPEHEVDPLHQHVHGHDRPAARRRSQHGRVVAGGHLEPWIGR